MSGIQFEFSFNAVPVLKTLWRMAGAIDDLSPLMDNIGRELVTAAVGRIAVTNVAPDGVPWLQSKRALEEGGPTLHDSEGLVNSINHWAMPDHVLVGSNKPYAAVMQFGAEQGAFGAVMGRRSTGKGAGKQDYFIPLPWGDIPARPYLGISPDSEEEIHSLTKDFFSSIVNGIAG